MTIAKEKKQAEKGNGQCMYFHGECCLWWLSGSIILNSPAPLSLPPFAKQAPVKCTLLPSLPCHPFCPRWLEKNPAVLVVSLNSCSQKEGPFSCCAINQSVYFALLGDGHTVLSFLKPFTTPLYHHFHLITTALSLRKEEQSEGIAWDSRHCINILPASFPRDSAVAAGSLWLARSAAAVGGQALHLPCRFHLCFASLSESQLYTKNLFWKQFSIK